MDYDDYILRSSPSYLENDPDIRDEDNFIKEERIFMDNVVNKLIKRKYERTNQPS